METDTTNYLNLSICLITLLSAHAVILWFSIHNYKEEEKSKLRTKKKKSR